MEPTPKTMEQIGQLCSTWSYLEARTEQAVWGIIGVTPEIGRYIAWRLDLRGRWTLILQEAPKKHDKPDVDELREIHKQVGTVARDRNIIVHGLVHAIAKVPPGMKAGDIAGKVGADLEFKLIPSWMVFRGAEAGKSFPISSNAVEIVTSNIQKVAERVAQFNRAHGYNATNPLSEEPEADWPRAL